MSARSNRLPALAITGFGVVSPARGRVAEVVKLTARNSSQKRSSGWIGLIAHPIRAILLARAVTATLLGRRANNAVSHGRCLLRRQARDY